MTAFKILCVLGLAGTLTASTVLGQTSSAGNVSEPSTGGVFYLLDSSRSPVSLEFKSGDRNLVRFSIQGDHSPVRFGANTAFQFLVRLPSRGSTPSSTPTFYRYDAREGWRTLAVEVVGKTVRIKSGTDAAKILFDSANVGTESLLLTPKGPLVPGEYCWGTGSSKEVYCFGVDPAITTSDVSQPTSTTGAGNGMTNADVLKMLSAGLSPDVVIASIRQAPAHTFDMSVDNLIALKKSQVPDSVISAMQQFVGTSNGTSPQTVTTVASNTAATRQSAVPPEPPDVEVFYYVNGAGKLAKLEVEKADVMDAHKTLTEGNQAKFEIFGAKSPVRIMDGAVTLVFKLPPPPNTKGLAGIMALPPRNVNDIVFRRWEPSPGKRELWIRADKARRGQQRDPDPGQFDFALSKVGENFYKITPNEPLIPGEYCISLTTATKDYCFGIDPSR